MMELSRYGGHKPGHKTVHRLVRDTCDSTACNRMLWLCPELLLSEVKISLACTRNTNDL